MTDPHAAPAHRDQDGDRTIANCRGDDLPGSRLDRSRRAHAAPGHVPPGRRASLVDAVMDLPEVQASARAWRATARGDTQSLERLRQRTRDAVPARPAGTALADADIPRPGLPSRRAARRRTVRWLIAPPVPARGLARQGACGPVLGTRRFGGSARMPAVPMPVPAAGQGRGRSQGGAHHRHGGASQPGPGRPGPASPGRLTGPRSRAAAAKRWCCC